MSIYSGLPAVALSALPVTQPRTASTRPQLATSSPATRSSGSSRTWASASFQTAAAVLRRHPRRDDPADRVERRHHRRQPADLLDGAAPAAARPAAPHQPALPHAGDRRSRVFGAIACVVMLPGPGEFLGNAVRVRRDAVVHDRARLADRAALAAGAQPDAQAARRRRGASEEEAWYRAPFNVRVRGVDVPLFAVIGGLGTFAAWIAVMALHTTTLIVGIAWMAIGLVSYYVYRRSQGLSLTETRRSSCRRRSASSPSRTRRCWSRSRRARSRRTRWRRHSSSPRTRRATCG